MTSTFSDYACITNAEDRVRVARLEQLFIVVKGAKGTGTQGTVLAECAVKAGMKRKTFQNQFYAWMKLGAIGCADKRKVAKVRATPDVLPVYRDYLELYRGQGVGYYSAAHRRMMSDFRTGKLFRGIGTWREVWRLEFPGKAMPVRCPVAWVPHGWGYANLVERLGADPTFLASQEWNVRGAGAASKFIRDVMRSRLDERTGKQLPGGSVYQWDDAYDNLLVTCMGHPGLWRPIGFHCYDVGTGYHLPAFQKPRPYSHTDTQDRIAGDGLTEQMFAMMFFYVHAVIGFHRDGVTHVLEKGTTAIRDAVRDRLKMLPDYGSRIHFLTGTPKTEAAHKGLFLGRFGHPQMKSIVEGAHRYRQLETADLPGAVGNSAANKPEDLEAYKGHEEKFIAKLTVADLPEEIVKMFSKRFLEWSEYQVVAGARSDAINDTHEHRLEGWGERYHVEEFADPDAPGRWYPMAMLDTLTPVTQERIAQLMMADPRGMVRSRRMSRREAWATWQNELDRVPLTEMWYFMDPRWAKELTVTPKRTIKFSDERFYGKGVEMVYEAKVVDAEGNAKYLAPGQKVRVYFNAWGELQNHIWIASEADEPLGMANRIEAAFWADPAMIKEEAKRKLIDMAQVLHDTRSRHWEDGAERIALEAGRRILLETAKAERARPVTMGAKRKLAFEDVASTVPPPFSAAGADTAAAESSGSTETDDILSRFGELVRR